MAGWIHWNGTFDVVSRGLIWFVPIVVFALLVCLFDTLCHSWLECR